MELTGKKSRFSPKTKACLGGVAVILIIVAGLFCPFHKETKDKSAAAIGAVGPSGAAGTQDASGKGPDSPSVAQDTAADGREVVKIEVPIEKQRLMGIATSAAAVKPLKKTLRTVGRVEFDERKLTTVNIKVDGWVDTLYVNYTGQYVKKGMPLAEIYSPELMSLQLELLNIAKYQEKGARFQRNIEFNWGDRYGTTGRMTTFDTETLLAVARQKLALWEIPEAQIKKMEETGTPIRTVTVKSPANGYVYQKPVVKGTRVAPGEKLFDIVDLSTVGVLADIYEYEMPFVKKGQQARITLSYYPEKEFPSKVDFIYPSLSGQTRTLKARFVVPNPDGLFKPQMFANVEMEIDMGERLAVPETAVLDTGARQVVYVDAGEGYFSPRLVKLGAKAGGMVEVLHGLKPGEKVASSGVFLIDSDAKLKGVSQ
jgi:membrane fusion protein, copper/silver efflux system